MLFLTFIAHSFSEAMVQFHSLANCALMIGVLGQLARGGAGGGPGGVPPGIIIPGSGVVPPAGTGTGTGGVGTGRAGPGIITPQGVVGAAAATSTGTGTDRARNCARFSTQCDDANYRKLLAQYCEGTCGREDCVDQREDLCKNWNTAAMPFCQNPFYTEAVRRQWCQRTCALCQPTRGGGAAAGSVPQGLTFGTAGASNPNPAAAPAINQPLPGGLNVP